MVGVAGVTDLIDFVPTYSDDDVEDLRHRLRRTRWDEIPVEDGPGGVDVVQRRDLCVYWAESYDFDAHRSRLAALAAWILEKLVAWSDCRGDLETVYGREDVLDLLTEYWVTATIGSSIRMYRAKASIPREQHACYVERPSGFSVFAGDITHPPRAWLDRRARTVHATEPARGGHFAPYEQPVS